MWVHSLIIIAAVVTAQQQDPVRDFCRRYQHQTCVINNKLYIDGGKVYYGGSVENGSVAQQSKLRDPSTSNAINKQTTGSCGRTS